jgi:lysophospholipase L1-like esterase
MTESATHPLLGKTGRALMVMLGALAIPYATPRLRDLRVVTLGEGDTPPSPAHSPPPEPAAGLQSLPASENRETVNNALSPSVVAVRVPEVDPAADGMVVKVPIEDPSGHALDAFFARLKRTERGEPGAVTRLLYYGDSTIASDYISGTVRRRLQSRFGDAGHGFILIANPWEWYFHNDVSHGAGSGWSASRLAGPISPDGMYGLGGVSFSSYGGGVAWFGTAARGDTGRNVSRFDLYYLEQPGGGDVEVGVAGEPAERFSTRGEEKASRVHAVRVNDGEAKLTVRAVGGGPVRLFGVALERDRPGVVCDALGSHAAMAVYWKRQDRDHWRQQMTLRDPALVVFQYGTNESDLWKLDGEAYERALAEVVDELRDVAEGASLLIVAPLDRAEARGGQLETKPVILDLVAIQRRVALSHGVAFWSAFDAMGGRGSMARWVRAKPQLAGGDLTHPTPLGAELLGGLLSNALVAAFEQWRGHGD